MNARIRSVAGALILCVALPVAAAQGQAVAAQGQAAEERYLAARDAAADRFTPARVPNIGQRELDAEAKARAELDKLIRVLLGSGTPPGFDAGKYNVSTLFSGDMDFGKLDGIVFEADGGDTQMVVSTRSLLSKWLQAKFQDAKDRLAPGAAIKTENFYLRAMGSDAAILRYVEIPLDVPDSFAMLSARTQDTPPTEADEVFVTAIRGERVFVASARFEPALSVESCTTAREASEARIEQTERTEFKSGQRNDAALQKLMALREQVESDFRSCFAERAPKEKGFADAVNRARELLDRMLIK